MNITQRNTCPAARRCLRSAIGVATVGLAFAGGSALAQNGSMSAGSTAGDQQLSPITVEAHHRVHRKQVGISYTGIPIEQITLSRQVGYGDLNLSTSQGQATLERRIRDVAKEACEQLDKMYPLDEADSGGGYSDNRTCVSDAEQGAMKQAKTVIAERSRRGNPSAQNR